MSALTQDRLKELLHYDPDSGLFHNRVDRGRVRAGSLAGATQRAGYVIIGVDGVRYYAHRLAWMYEHGAWPELHLDHKDGDRGNNRIVNLREVNDSQNGENRDKPRSDNRSGLMGVSRHESGLWFSRITVDRINCHLGYFKTPEEANSAYIAVKSELHKFSNRLQP